MDPRYAQDDAADPRPQNEARAAGFSPRGHSKGAPKTASGTLRLLLAGLAITVALILAKNPVVILLLATDGVLALAVLLAAGLGGLAVLPVLRLGDLPVRHQVLFGTGVGLGLLSMAVMLLGWAGLMQRPLWVAILAAAAMGGGLRAWRIISRRNAATPAPVAGPWRWLWLLVCPFLALAILVACVPPGYLWAEEGNGYDVLEYHLQMPREYLEAGRIHYAPHNVYANFPANVEMLYLLCMILRGDAVKAAIACQLVNAGLAVLTVAAAWMIGGRRSPAGGIVAAVVASGVGWLTYLSGVAYVENGMLLFGMLAAGAMLEALEQPAHLLRWCSLAGLLAGFAFGCKYTAGAMIGLPLVVALAVGLPGAFRRRVAAAGVCLASLLLAFLPWAAKNTAMTGNPVFPLANTVFKAYPDGWGPAQSEHFAASHTPSPDERGLGYRMGSLWGHVAADPNQRFGGLLLLFAGWTAVARRRDPAVRACCWMLLVQVPVWLFATHLYARFAVPLLIPLLVLAGRVPLDATNTRRAAVVLLVLGTVLDFGFAARLYCRHMFPDGRRFDLEGVTDFFTQGAGLGHEHLAVINRDLADGARVLLIGDAKAFYFRRPADYCVVFNRSPFVELVRSGAPPAEIVKWLADRGYTCVVVNWSEIARLRASRYGFPAEITPQLFGRLAHAGLIHADTFVNTSTGRPYADLYRVPSTDSAAAPGIGG